jgi:hypothetical protein
MRATHVVAPNALFLVSSRIAEKVLVMTATNRLSSQKLRIRTPEIKNKHDQKNSASIMAYITGDQLFTPVRIKICKDAWTRLSKLSMLLLGFNPVS